MEEEHLGSPQPNNFIETIIIGCGPAAIQCAYYFEKNSIDYLILERNDACGSFFSKYPHSGQLISINKKHTGSENEDFNLRHDWNSLLNDEKRYFTKYTDKYYPERDTLVKYLNDFARNNKLKIAFNKSVSKITKENGIYKIQISNTNEIYTCNKLIIATGLSKPNYPEYTLNVKDPIKHYGDYDVNYFTNAQNMAEFTNKRVMIIGNGNSAYELANILTKYASSILLLSRSPSKLALISHYAGDVRGIYLSFIDTFLLKSLNAVDTIPNAKTKIEQIESGGKYKLSIDGHNETLMSYENYDKIIFCTGWKFDDSIFDFDIAKTRNGKYPEVKSNYESVDNAKLYFIGSLMHSFDYKKSSGGFIHGFRYLIKLFVNINFNNNNISHQLFRMKYTEDVHSITRHIVNRINTSSDMYQMFGVIEDVFYFNPAEKQIIYYKNITHNLLNVDTDKCIIKFRLSLEYGKRITDVEKIGSKLSEIGSEANSAYLHPVIKIYNEKYKELIEIVHLDEDLFARYDNPIIYYDRIFRMLQSYSVE